MVAAATAVRGGARATRWWPLLAGPLLTLATAGVVQVLAGTPLYLPVPHPLMLTAVVYATFVGGWRPGAASVAIMLAYTAYYFSLPGQFLRYDDEHLRRIVVLAAVSPLMVAVVDVLKRRSEAAVAARDAADRSRAELLATVTHQVRGPLSSIRGAAELLRLRAGDRPDPPAARALDLLEQQVAVLDRLVEAVLEGARIEDGRRVLRPEPVPVGAAVAEAAARCGGPDRPRLTGDPAPVVQADRAALVDVLANLLDNAVRYGAPPVGLDARAAGRGQVRITVRDHGPGIPADQLDRVFEKFHRVEGAPPAGYGLGLFICRQLVEAQGGRIAAGNDPAGGAVFTLELPAARRAGAR